MLKFCHDILSEFHDVADIDVATQKGVAYLFEALLDGLFVHDCRLVELLKGSGDFPA